MRTLLCLGLGVFVFGCGDDSSTSGNCGTATPVSPTAADVQMRIFSCSCAFSGCHDATSNRTVHNPLDTMADSCASLRKMSCEFPTQKRVDPQNPDNSILIKKLTCATRDCTPELGAPAVTCQVKDTTTGQVLNQRMPASDNPPLDPGRLATLRSWIAMDLPGCPPPDGGAVDAPASDATSDAD